MSNLKMSKTDEEWEAIENRIKVNKILDNFISWLEDINKPKSYTVWVGGTEVLDHYVSKQKADSIAKAFIKDGYEDVHVCKVKNNKD